MVGLYELFTKKAGIEKSALNTAQLISMAENFARRGKLDRFETLLENRSKALNKVLGSRGDIQRNLNALARQEHEALGTTIGPEQLKYERAFFRRPMVSMEHLSKDISNGTRRLFAPNPIKEATLDTIVDIVRHLRKNNPGELTRINNPAIRKAEADKWIQGYRSM